MDNNYLASEFTKRVKLCTKSTNYSNGNSAYLYPSTRKGKRINENQALNNHLTSESATKPELHSRNADPSTDNIKPVSKLRKKNKSGILKRI